METDYVFNMITSTPKWYAGKFSKSYASKIVRLHREDMLSDRQYRTLFAKFGYYVFVSAIKWIKPSDCKNELYKKI